MKIDGVKSLLDNFNVKKEHFGYKFSNNTELLMSLGFGVNGSKQEIYGSKVHIKIIETEKELISLLAKSHEDLNNFIEGYLK